MGKMLYFGKDRKKADQNQSLRPLGCQKWAVVVQRILLSLVRLLG